MRKTILLLFVVFLFQACDPDKWMNDYHTCDWYVKNDTEQTLTITFPPRGNKIRVYTAHAGDSILFYAFNPYTWDTTMSPTFDLIEDHWADLEEDKLLVSVSSEDGTLLKEWKYSEKDSPGKQLFSEGSWQYYKEYRIKGRIAAAWVFEILPEDITAD